MKSKKKSDHQAPVGLSGHPKSLAERVQALARKLFGERPPDRRAVTGPNAGSPVVPQAIGRDVQSPRTFPDQELENNLVYDGCGAVRTFMFGDDMVTDTHRRSSRLVVVRRDPHLKIGRKNKGIAGRKCRTL